MLKQTFTIGLASCMLFGAVSLAQDVKEDNPDKPAHKM